jgi:hypothetical protein
MTKYNSGFTLWPNQKDTLHSFSVWKQAYSHNDLVCPNEQWDSCVWSKTHLSYIFIQWIKQERSISPANLSKSQQWKTTTLCEAGPQAIE